VRAAELMAQAVDSRGGRPITKPGKLMAINPAENVSHEVGNVVERKSERQKSII
jgi:hypothetical protein